jgi:sugar/nucleoside kinase (ribokinase family)
MVGTMPTHGNSTTDRMLGCVGDLLEDIVVHVLGTVNHASDTDARVIHRRGGSAANVVDAACRAGHPARLIAQVGDDPTGEWLCRDLTNLGADLCVRREGRTGSIVVLVHHDGERTMLADRAAAIELSDPDPTWLDHLHTLHIPYYSLAVQPLGATATTLARWAHERGIAVSIDASSASVLESEGVAVAVERIASCNPTVVLANELEAATIGDALTPARLGGATVVVKRGADPADVLLPDGSVHTVPAITLEGVTDTTGAGDAFAAGFLHAFAQHGDAVKATEHGHRVAAAAVQRVSAER